MQEAAERYYDRSADCQFTTFVGYEWTGMNPPNGGNLHRNVIFKGGAPDQIYSTLQSTNPEDLWAWMQGQRDEGRDVLAIPHNGNLSNGRMFTVENFDGTPLTAELAASDPGLQRFVAECRKGGASQAEIEQAEKIGWDTGLKVVHPFTGAEVPVWIANFILSEYGTGAIFACPAHDQRDLDFARKYGLPVIPVVRPEGAGDDFAGDRVSAGVAGARHGGTAPTGRRRWLAAAWVTTAALR